MWGSNSTDCDKETGQCQCLEGNTGQQCDICGEWAVVTSEGCENCTGCTAILRDYIGELSDEIGETIRAKEAGGRISQDIEELIDMKNTAILLKVVLSFVINCNYLILTARKNFVYPSITLLFSACLYVVN